MAKKALAKIKEEGGSYIEKPFEFNKRAFTFPAMERCGQTVAKIEHLTHGYNNKRLFDDVSLSISRVERMKFCLGERLRGGGVSEAGRGGGGRGGWV